MSDPLWPHESQHTRPPCPSPTPGAYSNSCPSSWWCHPAISSSVIPFSSCPQSLPASESFPMSQLFAWGSQSIGVSASAFSPSKEHPGLVSFRMDWLDLLAGQGTLKNLLQHHSSKPSILRCSAFFTVQLSHPYMTSGKTRALTRRTFVGKVMSLLFNMLSAAAKSLQSNTTLCDPRDGSPPGSPVPGILQARTLEWVAISFSNMLSRLVITFLTRSKLLLISWLQSPSAVILEPLMEPLKMKSDTVSTVSPSISHEVMGPDAMFSECWALSQLFHSPLSFSSRGFLVPLHFLP